ncbi:MAG: glycosyltransferase family 87 protein [Bacteroidia bacterium]
MSRQLAYKLLFWIPALLLLEEALRYAGREGDFIGYVIAGEYALNAKDLYSHWLNTWPPLFSVFCIPIYGLDRVSPYLARALWQLGSLWAFYHTAKRLLFLLFAKKLSFTPARKEDEINPWQPLFLLPFLLAFKYLLDNLANVQINVMMLFLCVEAVYQLHTKKSPVLAAFLMALTLSLKVYTLFFFVWFILIRQWKMVLYTLGFCALLTIPCFLVYGTDQTLIYFNHWWTGIAQGFPMIHHKNQSFFAAIWRLTVPVDAGLGIPTHLFYLSMDEGKKLVYLLVLLAGAYPAWLIWKKPEGEKNLLFAMPLFLALIPLLSPLAWKAYFIFLSPALFQLASFYLNDQLSKWEKGLFWASCSFLILSSEIFIGPYLSDIAELFSLITLGGIGIVFLSIYRLHRQYT